MTEVDLDSLDNSIELPVITECTICYVNPQDTLLPCSHSVCQSCYEHIESCPFCRTKIIKNVPTSIIVSVPVSVSVSENDSCSKRKFCICSLIIFAVPMAWLTFGMIDMYRY